MAVSANFHEYFQQNGRKIPTSTHDNPYTFHFQTGGVPIFEWMARFPARIASFNMAMTTASTQGTVSITLFPWREAVGWSSNSTATTATTTDETLLVVDIGGGRGQAAQVIREQLAGVPGRVIVQDLPGTIDAAQNEHPDVEKMAHNFFEPQPAKGKMRSPLPFTWVSPHLFSACFSGRRLDYSQSLVHPRNLLDFFFLLQVLSSTSCAESSTTGQMRSAWAF